MNAPRIISARAGSKQYSIIVGMGLEAELVEAVKKIGAGRIAVITDDTVGEKCGKTVVCALSDAGFSVELFTFPPGEKNKQQQTVSTLQNALLAKRYGRDTLIVALGGGVVGDVAGYVAATFLRGVPYIQVPTTLLAMVDSSIGGKVGIDTPHGKNMIGAFWHPQVVISDIRFLESLDRTQVISGVLEAVKCFISADKEALKFVDALSLEDPLSTPDQIQEIITRAAAFKAGVVERDEREENERRIINFGHTVGHAIELLSGYEMPHGFAVGYGMLVETKIAEDLGVLSPGNRATVCSYLERFGITPEKLKDFDVDDVLEAMKSDKKARAGAIYCVLLTSIGSVSTEGGQYAHPVEEAVIRKAYISLATA